ncbi:hypothetical protein Plhal304r1_c003g0010021 [Plasmopara halstedii]
MHLLFRADLRLIRLYTHKGSRDAIILRMIHNLHLEIFSYILQYEVYLDLVAVDVNAGVSDFGASFVNLAMAVIFLHLQLLCFKLFQPLSHLGFPYT